MTTTTPITNIGHLLDLTGYAGDFEADYDMGAVHADYLTAINDITAPGITIHASGEVFAEVGEPAHIARNADWHALLSQIDVAPIFERHDLAADADCDCGDMTCERPEHRKG